MWAIWQYGLSSFQGRDTKVFLAKNQYTQRKLLHFVDRHSTELSKIGYHFYKGFKNESKKKKILSKKWAPKLIFLNDKKDKIFH